MTEKIFPILKNLTEIAQTSTGISKNLRILYLGSEDLKIKPTHNFTGEDQNDFLQQHNVFMKELIEQYVIGGYIVWKDQKWRDFEILRFLYVCAK